MDKNILYKNKSITWLQVSLQDLKVFVLLFVYLSIKQVYNLKHSSIKWYTTLLLLCNSPGESLVKCCKASYMQQMGKYSHHVGNQIVLPQPYRVLFLKNSSLIRECVKYTRPLLEMLVTLRRWSRMCRSLFKTRNDSGDKLFHVRGRMRFKPNAIRRTRN